MTRQGHSSSSASAKPHSAGSLGRGEYVTLDDRPFAEVRKNMYDAWRMLCLHRWMFFVPFCFGASAAFVASLYYPRTYMATTSFERRNDPVMMNLPMSAGAASFKYFRNTMVRDLTSVECVAEAVEEMELMPDPVRDDAGELTPAAKRRRDALARSLAPTLSVSTSSPSELIDIIRVTYTGPDPHIGRKLVDQVKRTYIRRTMEWIHQFLVSQRDYFRQEAGAALEELQKAQRAETLLRLQYPYFNPTDPSAIAMKLSQLDSERRELLMRRREYEAELAGHRQLLAQLRPARPSVLRTPQASVVQWETAEIERLQGRIDEIDRKIQELRRTRGMTDQHPEIVELLDTRASYEQALAAELPGLSKSTASNLPMSAAPLSPAPPSAGPDPASTGSRQADRSRLAVQIASLEAKLKDVEISLQTNERETQQLREAKEVIFSKQEEFAEVAGAVARARQKYNQLESTVAQIEPAIKAIEQDRLLQFSAGQPAGGASTPVSPRAVTVVLLALLAGAGAGVLFVVLAELLDNVFRSSTQVARSLGLPILEAIDEIVTTRDRRRLLVQKAVVTPLVVTFCLGVTGLSASMAYLSITQPWTYQKLRKIPQTALQFFVEPPSEDRER